MQSWRRYVLLFSKLNMTFLQNVICLCMLVICNHYGQFQVHFLLILWIAKDNSWYVPSINKFSFLLLDDWIWNQKLHLCCILYAEFKDSEPTDYPEDVTQNPNPKDFQEIMLNDLWEKAIGVRKVMKFPTDFCVLICLISQSNCKCLLCLAWSITPSLVN